MREPLLDVRRGALEPLRATARASARRRRPGRGGARSGEHRGRPGEHVGTEQRSRPCSARRRRSGRRWSRRVTTALSAGGRRAAIWSPLNPPHDLPMMPDARRCTTAARRATRAPRARRPAPAAGTRRACSPSESPRAAHVDADGGVAVSGEPGVQDGVAGRRAVVLAVRDVLEDRRHRIGLGVLGQPDARGEPGAVGKRDPRCRRTRTVWDTKGTPDVRGRNGSAGRALCPAPPYAVERLLITGSAARRESRPLVTFRAEGPRWRALMEPYSAPPAPDSGSQPHSPGKNRSSGGTGPAVHPRTKRGAAAGEPAPHPSPRSLPSLNPGRLAGGMTSSPAVHLRVGPASEPVCGGDPELSSGHPGPARSGVSGARGFSARTRGGRRPFRVRMGSHLAVRVRLRGGRLHRGQVGSGRRGDDRRHRALHEGRVHQPGARRGVRRPRPAGPSR